MPYTLIGSLVHMACVYPEGVRLVQWFAWDYTAMSRIAGDRRQIPHTVGTAGSPLPALLGGLLRAQELHINRSGNGWQRRLWSWDGRSECGTGGVSLIF